MARAYLVTVGPDQGDNPRQDETGQAAGLRLRIYHTAFSVYTSNETRALDLPCGCVIIGDVYTRSGDAVRRSDQLPATSSAARLLRYMLAECWGDYVILIHEPGTPSPLTITRSPSPACDLPCFYGLDLNTGFVTSHITLAERTGLYRRQVDFDHIAHLLAYPGLKTSRTALFGIRELLPGTTARFSDGWQQVDAGWSPWKLTEEASRLNDLGEAALAVRNAVQLVVQTWAKEDQSVLLELSGGLDSSIVGACLGDSDAHVSCTTISSPAPGSDERDYATLVAEALHAELHTAVLCYEDASYQFPLPRDTVTPAIGPLQYVVDRTLQAAGRDAGVITHFSGGGGDTVFGYLTNIVPVVDAFLSCGLRTGLKVLRDLSMFHQCTYWRAARLAARKLKSNYIPWEAHRAFLSPLPLPEPEPHPWSDGPDDSLPGDRQRILELSSVQLFRDSSPRSMAGRLRMPLLAQPVVEACLRIPSWMWFDGGQNRAVARAAFAHALPPRILARRSKGSFSTYLGVLYRRKLNEIVNFLTSGQLEGHGLLDADGLKALIGSEMPRGENAFLRLFHLCSVENWIRQQ